MSGEEPTVEELLGTLRGYFGQATTQTKISDGERANFADQAWKCIAQFAERLCALERENSQLRARVAELKQENNRLRDPEDPEGWKALADRQRIEQLVTENAQLRADSERLRYWFSLKSPVTKLFVEQACGDYEKFTLDEWRDWLDRYRAQGKTDDASD